MVRRNLIMLIISNLAFTACGQGAATQSVPVTRVPADFSPYVQKFEDVSAQHGHPTSVSNLIIQFGTLSSGANEYANSETGNCETGAGTPTITIDPAAWAQLDDAGREALVFHELGHCVLRRVHKTGITDDGIPDSIMSPFAIDSRVYAHYESFYYQELFQTENQF